MRKSDQHVSRGHHRDISHALAPEAIICRIIDASSIPENIDLLVMNTKDDDQLAMNGRARTR
ncbi:MAG: hypothetical protein R3C20_17785 [Planctomycetaceae bacterium]